MNILGFMFIVLVLLMVEDCYGLDEKAVRYALDVAYKTDGNRPRAFIYKMWPEISSLIPGVVDLPKFKGNFGKNDILYATGNICPKVDNTCIIQHESNGCETENENCMLVGIKATLHLPNPVTFEIYKNDASGNKIKKVYASYTFGNQNTVMFWLRIPNFSEPRDKISTECVIYIDSFVIEDLSEPTVDESNLKTADAKEMVNKYWNSVKSSDIDNMMRIGIMKALIDKLYPGSSRASTKSKEQSICLSHHFINIFLKDVISHSDDGDGISGRKDGKEKKAGNRRTDNEEIIYEKIDSSEYIKSIQLGIDKSVSSLLHQPKRDVLMVDFMDTELKHFTPDMEETGPVPKPTFHFVTYAPVVFRHLRESFGIMQVNFLNFFCGKPLTELSNPGKSGSGLYLSQNKYFIAKTVQKVEADFLQVFLPGYLLNVYQNSDSLLPKFFGLYLYEESITTNLRLLVMNNLLPSEINIDRKYDLKGSTFQREVSDKENDKPSTTFKDLDFLRHHPQGIYLKPIDHKRLMKTIQRDCMVLQSFQIVDYSLLLGIHYVDGLKEKGNAPSVDESSLPCVSSVDRKDSDTSSRNFAQGGIPAVTASGEKLKLYVGIIDILQSYRLRKKFEHYWKSIVLAGKEFSVVDPTRYAHRFEDFMGKSVFKKMLKCQTAKTQNSLSLGQLMEAEDNDKTELRTTLDDLLKKSASDEKEGFYITISGEKEA